MAEQTETTSPDLSTDLPSAVAVHPEAEATRRRDLHSLLNAVNVPLVAILALAALLRFWDEDWDQHTHLHPDERFLTMVGNAMQLPASIGQYLDPATSHMNPANIGFTFYVYGTLPLILNRFVAALLNTNTYDTYAIQGRVLSGIADLLVVLLVYKIAEIFERKYGLSERVKYLAAFFYAVSVLAIQLSHFFAVDTFLNLFMIAAFYFALRYSYRPAALDAGLSAICFGLALGSKITAIYVAPLVAVFLFLPLLERAGYVWPAADTPVRSVVQNGDLKRLLGDLIPLALLYALIAYIVLRFADPYMFQTGNILDPRPSSLFMSNLQQVAAEASPEAAFPPSVQWLSKTPITFALVNVAVFGLGIPLFLFSVVGMYWTGARNFYSRLTLILAWMLIIFLYQSTRFADTMRYFICLYPFLALFAAIGFHALVGSMRTALKGVAIATIIIWPAAFMNIYTHPISRVQASQWMYQNLPTGSVILSEEWDDALPVSAPNPTSKTFLLNLPPPRNLALRQLLESAHYIVDGRVGLSVPVFNLASQAGLADAKYLLTHGDYLVLSSNRGWGSMPTVPSRYPVATQYYHDLFNGRPLPGGARYREIARFTDYPSLRYLGIPIDFPDQWSEEAFTVYDHPEVHIFEHVR